MRDESRGPGAATRGERDGHEREWVLAPRDAAGARRTGENALAARASVLSRIVGEAGGADPLLASIEVSWYSRRGKDPEVLLVARAGPGAAGPATGSSDADRRLDPWMPDLKATVRGALADHSPFDWMPAPRARRRQLERGVDGGHVARLLLRTAGAADQPLEVYPLRSSTIERALRRLRAPAVVRVRVLALPRRRGVPLRPLTSSHTYGRLVPVGAPDRGGSDAARRSDAADLWQYLVQVQVASRAELPHDLLAAIASDVRGTGPGSIGIVLGGQAAAVDAEWELDAARAVRPEHDAGWPADTVALNLRETACLVPLPSGADDDEPATQRLSRVPRRLPRAGTLVGTVAGSRRPVAIPAQDLFRHAFIIGATGSGKSTEQLNIVMQAIRDDAQPAVIVFDPHGSLVDAIAGRLTPDEQERVVWFDPSDPVAPMTWNPLDEGTPAVVDMLVAFGWEQWDPRRTMQAGMGPVSEQMMRAVLTTVMARPGSTLVDAFEVIQDDNLASRYLPHVTDQPTRGFWRMRSEMTAQQKGEYANYLTSKFSPFAHDPVLRPVIGRDSTLDVPAVIRDGKILLISVRKAVVGTESTTILVRLLKRRIWRAITARGAGGPEQRPVLLAIDEFIDYQQPELDAVMLQAGRKFHTSLVLATQNLASIDPSLREAIAANAASMLAFRVGVYDAGVVSSMLGDASIAPDLTTLPNFRAVARVPLAGEPMPPVLIDATKPPKGFSAARVEEVRADSRARYGVPLDGSAADTASADAASGSAIEGAPLVDELLSVVRACGLAAGLDDEGDIRVEGVLPVPMWMVAGDVVRLLTSFEFRDGTGPAARLELARAINNELRIVRAAVTEEDEARLELDWYLPIDAATTTSVLRAALMRFGLAVRSALEVDMEGLRILVVPSP